MQAKMLKLQKSSYYVIFFFHFQICFKCENYLKDSVHFDSKKWNLLLNFFSTQNDEFSSDSIDFFFW